MICPYCEDEIDHINYDYSQTEYGTGIMHNLDDSEDTEIRDYENYQIDAYTCPECGTELSYSEVEELFNNGQIRKEINAKQKGWKV